MVSCLHVHVHIFVLITSYYYVLIHYLLSSDIPKVVANTTEICKVTHADPRCVASCIAVTTAVSYTQGLLCETVSINSESNFLKFRVYYSQTARLVYCMPYKIIVVYGCNFFQDMVH